MRRAIKVLSVLATVCVMAWAASPAWANCPFSLPMLQGGDTGLPPGALLTSATHVNGFFWELGFGDPADAAGNDSNSLISGWPAFTQATPSLQWIKGAGVQPEVDYDWFNNGIDNCISGGSGGITTTVLVYYIIDSNDEYAIAALQGTSSPVDHNTLDLLVTGIGPNGNDVGMGPRTVVPQLSTVTVVDDGCLDGDVGPATDGMNLYSDAAGPYAGVVDVGALTLLNGVTAETCDPDTGCHLTCIARDANLCWVGDVDVIANQVAGAAVCIGGVLDGFACDPNNPADACLAFNGLCPPGALTTIAFGPPIAGACEAIAGPNVDDHAIARATKSRGFTIFTWDATQFAVSHFNLFDVTRGDRLINHDVIARQGSNDGSVTSYEFVATGADVRGGKRFELEMVRTDGQKVRFTVE